MTKSKFSSLYLWIIPAASLVLCGWFIVRFYSEKGTEISIFFQDASSIYPEKTRIMFKGVPIGVVTNVSISTDSQGADCKVTLYKGAESFAKKGSIFKLITPQIGLAGVSGLETLISGSYISAQIGNENSEPAYSFKGSYADGKEESNAATPGLKIFLLKAEDAESLGAGDSVYFRGLMVGKIVALELNPSAQFVDIEIGIERKHSRLIRENTVFWKKSGVQANLSLFGAEVKVGSLDALMKGGVELGVPDDSKAVVAAGYQFTLQKDRPADKEIKKWNPSLKPATNK